MYKEVHFLLIESEIYNSKKYSNISEGYEIE